MVINRQHGERMNLPKIFNSRYPILEACMNRGSTLELAVAVHNAGAYPSLCSSTYLEYNRPVYENLLALKNDLISFVKITKSHNIHISFDLEEFSLDPNLNKFYRWQSLQRDIFRKNIKICHNIIKEFAIPTVEIIYGNSNTPRPTDVVRPDIEGRLIELTQPFNEMGTKVFNRTYDPVTEEIRKKYFFDGFCVKGSDSSGFGGTTYTVKELFLLQKQLTPDVCVIPYGGVGTGAQVKEYFNLGADMVAVGSVLAYSKESPISDITKQLVVSSTKDTLQQYKHTFTVNNNTVTRKQSRLLLENQYQGLDDGNHTKSLEVGLSNISNTGHVFIGHAIDHINEVLPVDQIIQNLMVDFDKSMYN